MLKQRERAREAMRKKKLYHQVVKRILRPEITHCPKTLERNIC
jgi:hypothetical protein